MKSNLTSRLERDIKLSFNPDIFDRIFKTTTRYQRLNANWYIAQLAVKLYKSGDIQGAYKMIDNFIKEELNEVIQES